MTSLKKFKQRLHGELVKSERPIDAQQKLMQEPKAKETEEVSIVDVAEVEIEDIEDVTEDAVEVSKLESMTKTEIDGYAAEHGIQLDRRQSKFNMITEFIQKIEEKN